MCNVTAWFSVVLSTIFLVLSDFAVRAQTVAAESQSWAQVKKAGRGTITVYWYESQPFIYRTALGMGGIEYELMENFRKYLKKAHKIDLRIAWKEAKSFGDTYASVRDVQQNGTFAASAFSITPEREGEVGFSPPYMSDISVHHQSKNIPIVQSTAEFDEVFSRLTAITIQETTYEQDIQQLKDHGKLPFRIQYIPSSKNILYSIAEKDSAFGFIDLPVYMMIYNENPSVNVKRQNLYPVKRKGYAIIYPLKSDWAEPVSEFFAAPDFPESLERGIGNYIDIELYHFIESLAVQPNDMVVLLTKEKEIQYRNLLGKSQQIAKETRARNFLIVTVTVTLIFLLTIVILYRKQTQQKRKIESQRMSIELKNEQLEKKPHHLVTLDEEKNNLIKILAHDLRTPINHVQGMAQVFMLSNNSLPDDQKVLIQGITDAAVWLNKMISNILDIDSIENNRVKIFMDDVAITPLVSQVVKSFDKQAARKNVELVATTGVSAVIKGDSLFLTQVFENLISNAIKFSERDKKVEVIVSENGSKVRIAVKDNGPGLTEEDHRMLFKKFQRLSAKPTDGENSTGLGLSIVKKYVELMNGVVWCESEPGKGASFIIEFAKL